MSQKVIDLWPFSYSCFYFTFLSLCLLSTFVSLLSYLVVMYLFLFLFISLCFEQFCTSFSLIISHVQPRHFSFLRSRVGQLRHTKSE